MLSLHKSLPCTAEVAVCFLCDEESSNVRFMPCGHTVMCNMCAKNTKKCPKCQVLTSVGGCSWLIISLSLSLSLQHPVVEKIDLRVDIDDLYS